MRDKESSDQERKNLTRNLDKAGKALDKLAESEKALTTRIVSDIPHMDPVCLTDNAYEAPSREGSSEPEEGSGCTEGADERIAK